MRYTHVFSTGCGTLLVPWLAILGSCAAIAGCARDARPIVSSEKVQARSVDEHGPGAALLWDTAKRAVEAGASPLELLGEGVGIPGDSITAMIHVPQGRCALLLARGGPTVEDIDLLTYGEDGTQYGVDEAPDDLPTLLLCPEEPRRIFVGARLAQGTGPIALGLHDVPRERADRVAQVVGARNHPADVRRGNEPWPGLEDAVTRHRQDVGGKWVDVRRVALPVDARVPTRVTAEVPAERCLDALVLPGEGVAHLDLTASDENGRIFARARPQGPNRSLLLCATDQPSSVGLEVRPHAGRGVALLVLSTTKNDASQAAIDPEVRRYPLGSPEQPPSPIAHSHDDRPLPRKVHAAEPQLEVGRTVSSEIATRGCNRIDFAPLEPLIGYEVHAWDPGGNLVGRIETPVASTFFVCGKEPVRLDLEATRRAGPLAFEVRREREVAEELVRYPLAASRLLGLAHSLGFVSRAEDIGKVEAITVRPDHLQRFEFRVPTKRCQTIMVGAGPEAWGLELRLINAETGMDLDFSRGAHTVSARACGEGETARVVAELRSARGSTTALVSSRQTELP